MSQPISWCNWSCVVLLSICLIDGLCVFAHSVPGFLTICYWRSTIIPYLKHPQPTLAVTGGILLRNNIITVYLTIGSILFLLASASYTLDVNNNSQLISYCTVCTANNNSNDKEQHRFTQTELPFDMRHYHLTFFLFIL